MLHLLFEAGSIVGNVLLGEHLAHVGTAGGVADHGGTAANQGDGAVAGHLQPLHQGQGHKMAGGQAVSGAVKADVECCLAVVDEVNDLFVGDLRHQAAGFEFFVQSHRKILLFLGQREKKTPSAKREIWQRARKIAVPPLFAAPSRKRPHEFSLQLREVFRLLFCTLLAPTGASLGRTVQGTYSRHRFSQGLVYHTKSGLSTPIPGLFQHFAGVGTGKLRHMVAGDEMRQCIHAAVFIQRMDLGIGPLIGDVFLDQQMAVRQSCDLRRVGDAQNLMSHCTLAQYLTNAAGCFARNAAVDLIVNDGRHSVFVCHGVFDGQRDAAQLTARGDFRQRFGRFAGVC